MTPDHQAWNLDTRLVHGGHDSRISSTSGTPTVLPIYATTTYLYETAEALDQAFDGNVPGGGPAFVYGRQSNPNADAFEVALAQAEGGVGAVAFASGMGAIHAALLAAGLVSGTKIVVSQDIYGSTIDLLQQVYAPVGVEVILRDLCTPHASDIIREEQPDVIYVETLSNPLVKMVDLDAISAAARHVGAVTIIDSTFTTPYLLRPIEHGFDLVVHSTTKYIGGHGDSTGGIAISANNVLLKQLRTYALLLGASLSPFESSSQLRGLRTLSLRMERHCSNALHVARFLQEHPAVAHVYYPGLANHPQRVLASQLFPNERYGGLLAFDLKEQSRDAAFCFMNNLRLCLPAPSLGDVFTLVSYPPMSSHRSLSEKERYSMGITASCIRLSVGIEHIEDIVNDLNQALLCSISSSTTTA